jgi:hypothetical protein
VTIEVSLTMRVRFLQSGGIVGASRGVELESARLSAADARELQALVQSSGILESGEFRSPAGRDLRVYEIQIESGAGIVAVTFDDRTLPEQARPLVSFLRRNAKPRDRGA